MKTYDLYAIGNALVDSEYEVSDTQLQATGARLPRYARNDDAGTFVFTPSLTASKASSVNPGRV